MTDWLDAEQVKAKMLAHGEGAQEYAARNIVRAIADLPEPPELICGRVQACDRCGDAVYHLHRIWAACRAAVGKE